MSLRIVDVGALTTVQDRGRSGWAHLGVPPAGALDQPAAGLANRLVGDAEDCAVLEATLGGLSFVALRACVLAVTGARADVTVDGRAVAFAEAVPVRAGSLVVVGRARTGVRSYVAVGGAIDVDRVLGSRSTDTLSWLGPAPLRAGTVLPLGRATGEPAWVDVPVEPPRTPLVLRLHPGPRADWLGEGGLAALDGRRFRVGSASNRVGLRLEGAPLARSRADELPSEGIVLGALQLPPSGEPVVFLRDHPATGGYPVVAVVDPGDLPGCAQARPGDEVCLRVLG